MGVNSYELDEYGYALCCSCRRKYRIGDLEEQCGICNRWFCKFCAKPTPQGHGSGKICKNCYNKIKNS